MEGTNEVQRKRKKTRPPRGAARRTISPHVYSHPFEVRRKAVQLCLEESFPVERVAREMGVGRSTLSKWVRLYRDQGEAGLQSKSAGPSPPRPKVAAAVKTKVVELKRRHPDLGIKKISQFLRRMWFLPVSRETVRRTLHRAAVAQKTSAASPRAIPPSRASSSAPRPTRCGRPISSPSGWEARTPTSSALSTITPATWWGWTCFAARRRSTC